MLKHREGILAWYDHKIATAMVEGINNKIKVMKREAYGFTDDRYFKLVGELVGVLTKTARLFLVCLSIQDDNNKTVYRIS